MATRKSKCSLTGDLNLQEGAIFSRSLNDNRRMIMTGLYSNVYSKKNTNPNRNLEKTNRNRTMSSEQRVTDISINHGSPNSSRLKYGSTGPSRARMGLGS